METTQSLRIASPLAAALGRMHGRNLIHKDIKPSNMRSPVAPSERVVSVPAEIASIVMKLLAKTAEDRYQTAAGVVADLRRCLADLDALAACQ